MEGQKKGRLVQVWRVGRKEERIGNITLNCVLEDIKLDLSLRRLSGKEASFRWRKSQNSEVWDQGASSGTRDLAHVHPMFKQDWTLIDRDLPYTHLVGLFGATFLLLVTFYKCSPPSKLHRTLPGSLGSQIRVRLGPCPPRGQSSASRSTPPPKPVLKSSLLNWNYL